MTPFLLNLKVKNLKFLALHNFNHAATFEANNIIQSDFDFDYFTEDQIIQIVDYLDLFIIYIFINCKYFALESLQGVRDILDKVFTNNLLLVNRFCKRDIGTLEVLSNDLLLKIKQHVYMGL